MTLGEKIKSLRSKESITQEEFAEKLNVSRSAIAKWETDNGTPDIANLKMISQMFEISIDDLLNDEFGLSDSIIDEEETDTGCEVYAGYYWDIELKGWNDGVNDVLIIGEDEDFMFYRKKENQLYGVIGKRYITSIRRKGTLNTEYDCSVFIDRSYFCKKHVLLELAAKEGLIQGFFDFRNDDYMDVIINSITDTKISLKFGGEISIDMISKIEELVVKSI